MSPEQLSVEHLAQTREIKKQPEVSASPEAQQAAHQAAEARVAQREEMARKIRAADAQAARNALERARQFAKPARTEYAGVIDRSIVDQVRAAARDAGLDRVAPQPAPSPAELQRRDAVRQSAFQVEKTIAQPRSTQNDARIISASEVAAVRAAAEQAAQKPPTIAAQKKSLFERFFG